jgi:hypothetical protein
MIFATGDTPHVSRESPLHEILPFLSENTTNWSTISFFFLSLTQQENLRLATNATGETMGVTKETLKVFFYIGFI